MGGGPPPLVTLSLLLRFFLYCGFPTPGAYLVLSESRFACYKVHSPTSPWTRTKYSRGKPTRGLESQESHNVCSPRGESAQGGSTQSGSSRGLLLQGLLSTRIALALQSKTSKVSLTTLAPQRFVPKSPLSKSSLTPRLSTRLAPRLSMRLFTRLALRLSTRTARSEALYKAGSDAICKD